MERIGQPSACDSSSQSISSEDLSLSCSYCHKDAQYCPPFTTSLQDSVVSVGFQSVSQTSGQFKGESICNGISSSCNTLLHQNQNLSKKTNVIVKSELQYQPQCHFSTHSVDLQPQVCSSKNSSSASFQSSVKSCTKSLDQSPDELAHQENVSFEKDLLTFSQNEFLRTRSAFAERAKRDVAKNSGQANAEVAMAIHDFEESVEQRCSALPLAAQPTLLSTPLFPHQRQALYWEVRQEAERKSGGLLCDQMGLGKTIEMIALIAERQRPKGRFGTLVVAPSMGLIHWRDEIARHTNNVLSTVVVHTSNGTVQLPSDKLLCYDVVITSYGILIRYRVILDEAHNIKNKHVKLAQVLFRMNASYFWGLTGTPVQNKVNDLDALFKMIRVPGSESKTWFWHTVMRFFRLRSHVDGIGALRRLSEGYLLRRTKKQQIDGKQIIELPEFNVQTLVVSLPPCHALYYSHVFESCKRTVASLIKGGDVNGKAMELLSLLTRLRQCACHPFIHLRATSPAFSALCGKRVWDLRKLQDEYDKKIRDFLCEESSITQTDLHEAQSENVTQSHQTPNEVSNDLNEAASKPSKAKRDELSANSDCGAKKRKRNLFSQESSDAVFAAMPSPVFVGASQEMECSDQSFDSGEIITKRRKRLIFCSSDEEHPAKSISLEQNESRKTGHITSPVSESFPDVNANSHDVISSYSSIEKGDRISDNTKLSSINKNGIPIVTCAKIELLLNTCHKIFAEEPATKVVVFSQFTSFLDLVGLRLQKERLPFLRIDGKTTSSEREEVLSEFSEGERSVFLLVSLKVGGTVLNLTSASVVFLMDPWWNPAIAQQALERVWRIGQTKKVKAFHMIARGTVEESIIRIYSDKQKAASLALGGDDSNEAIGGSLSVDEIIRIFDGK